MRLVPRCRAQISVDGVLDSYDGLIVEAYTSDAWYSWRWLLQEYCPETLASRSITTMTGRPVTSVAGAREAARRVEAGGSAVAHLGSLFALVDIITLLLVSFPIP